MRNDIRDEILKNVITTEGKLHHFCLSKEWWIKRNIEYLYTEVFSLTNFLSETASFRERLFYIENNWKEPQLCPICNSNHLLFKSNTVSLTTICNDVTCRKIRRSEITKNSNRNLPDHIRIQKAEKCRISASRSLEQRCGSVKAQEIKERMRKRLLGKKQSKELIEKRLKWRKGTPHSEETRVKISASNKKTHNSVEYRTARAEKDVLMGKKLSIIMKEKIANGEFTPNITNSWTRRNIEMEINGVKIKFRSSWEAAYALVNPTFQYEKIRIPYTIQNEQKTYIVDFADFDNQVMYEIKPNSMKLSEKCQVKAAAARKWASENGWVYEFVTDKWFVEHLPTLEYLKFPYISVLKKGLKNAYKTTC